MSRRWMLPAALAVLSAAALALALVGCAATKDAAPASPSGSLSKEAERESAKPAGGEVKFVTPSKDYPLTTCVVTGEDLHEDGEPVAILWEGTEVQFCCPDCVEKFAKNPAPYLAKIKAATPPK